MGAGRLEDDGVGEALGEVEVALADALVGHVGAQLPHLWRRRIVQDDDDVRGRAGPAQDQAAELAERPGGLGRRQAVVVRVAVEDDEPALASPLAAGQVAVPEGHQGHEQPGPGQFAAARARRSTHPHEGHRQVERPAQLCGQGGLGGGLGPQQRNGQTQEPWTQRCEERTCRSRSQRRSEAKWQTTTDRRDGTQNRSKRSRNACALFQHAFPSRASTTARRTISTGGRPISAEPGYKRQLKANAFAWEDSPATSRPLMRIVGEPENARSVAMLSSLTSTS